MPTIADVDGTRIMMFPFDHDPSHIDAFGAISGLNWRSAMRGFSKPVEPSHRQ